MRVQQFLSSVLLGASALHQAHAAPVEERQAATIATTGAAGGVQQRMELRTMQQQHPDMFNVYLLGLQDMKSVAQSDPLSYYQIAGIHGRPYTPYDGATSQAGPAGYGGGYCTHTSNLFLPWHRPYLALYEQTLYTHVMKVANTFTGADKTKYVAAAQNFRIPYWDWAGPICSGCNAYPLLVSNQYATVQTPSGQQSILNPLFRYDFNPLSASDMVYNPFATWTVTKRYPTTQDASAVSQNNLVAPEIASNRVSFADRLYSLFQNGNFSQFGNEAWITSSTPNADSLESVHDAIHSITGNNGHMTYLDYSAFDPVFFLHHAMIDRLFAMYQIIYPNSYVQPMAPVSSTYTYPAGPNNVQTANSNLPPFHSDTKGTWYTSNSVVTTSHFNYNYPETGSGSTAASVRKAVNTLYGGSAGTSTVSHKKRQVQDNVGAAQGAQESATGNDTSYEYSCSIVSQKFQMNGSYAVYIFLGEPSDDVNSWSTDDKLVGTHGVFANFASEDTTNEMSNMDLKVTGSIPLTTSLINKVGDGELQGLAPNYVEPYLTSNLHWRVKMFNGQNVDAGEVPDLSVTVVGTEVMPAASDEDFPTWGQPNSYSGVTAGRPGGHDDAYWGGDKMVTHHSLAEHVAHGLGSTNGRW